MSTLPKKYLRKYLALPAATELIFRPLVSSYVNVILRSNSVSYLLVIRKVASGSASQTSGHRSNSWESLLDGVGAKRAEKTIHIKPLHESWMMIGMYCGSWEAIVFCWWHILLDNPPSLAGWIVDNSLLTWCTSILLLLYSAYNLRLCRKLDVIFATQGIDRLLSQWLGAYSEWPGVKSANGLFQYRLRTGPTSSLTLIQYKWLDDI